MGTMLYVKIEAANETILSLQYDIKTFKQVNQMLYREILESDIGNLDGYDNEYIINTLREYVYKKVKLGEGDFDYYGNHIEFLKDLINSKINMLCGGMAATYQWLLSLYDIPSRIVQLATKRYVYGKDSYGNHVTVDVYDSKFNKTYLSDPTFNVKLSCKPSKTPMNVLNLRKCLLDEKKKLFIIKGKTQIKGRTLSDYYLSYRSLLYSIESNKLIYFKNNFKYIISPIQINVKN
jgi:hypothetical protein